MTIGQRDSRIDWIIDIISRLTVEKTYVDGSFVARSHIERACREARVGRGQAQPLLELLESKGVLIPMSSDDGIRYVDSLMARQLVNMMLQGGMPSNLDGRKRRSVCRRLSREANERRARMKRSLALAMPRLTQDLAIAFNVLRSMAKQHEEEYRVCLPDDFGDIDDAWFDQAFVPTTRRVDCAAGMERLLLNRELFRQIGRNREKVVYAFRVDPHLVAVHLPDTAPLPRPLQVMMSRTASPQEMRAAI